MRAIASIGLIFATGAGLIVAYAASGETPSARRDQRLAVVPTSMNTGAALRLASFGVAELTTDDGVAVSTLHVRAVIANTTRDRPWALDISKMRLEAIAGAAVAPAFVNSDLTTLPIAIIDPAERRTIDLYFPLPAELTTRGPKSFALRWPISTPARVVLSAWFERDTAIPQSASDLALVAGWGRHWWFDPEYPWSTYLHRSGYATPRPPDHVTVTSAPRWDELSAVDTGDEQPRETECEYW